MPSKLRYNSFSDLKAAATTIKESWPGGLSLGKEDFKSAFKTLPPGQDQQWLCWALVYNTDLQRHQVVPLYTQCFGSLGAVVAWYRTVSMIQNIMSELFGLVVFVYVDACFWVAPDYSSFQGFPTASWIATVFQEVVTGLLGWDLDNQKRAVGPKIVLLGLEVSMGKDSSLWKLDDNKAAEWIAYMETILDTHRPCIAS